VLAASALRNTANWQALGTSVTLQLAAGGELEQARAIVERELDWIDRTCSRFRGDSDLARVNAAAGQMLTVDPLLIAAVDVALRAARLTDGAVTPTVGEALVLSGYDRDWSLLAAPGSPEEDGECGISRPPRLIARIRDGWRAIELNRSSCAIRVPAGVQLDLGATAKAWASDRAARAVHDALRCGVLVSLGGDIATAGEPPAAGWQVHVTDDHRNGANAPGQRITLSSGGLATSSSTVRRWRHAGATMHHIIDPATCAPARSAWRTVSVAAGNCTDANIASTAALVLSETAPRWLAERGLPARLVTHEGVVRSVGAWPAAGTEVGVR
jgi:thiamine biosynthesis lipoprotein